MILDLKPVASWIEEKLDYIRPPNANFIKACFPCVVEKDGKIEAVIATHKIYDNGSQSMMPQVTNGLIDLSLASFNRYARYDSSIFEKD